MGTIKNNNFANLGLNLWWSFIFVFSIVNLSNVEQFKYMKFFSFSMTYFGHFGLTIWTKSKNITFSLKFELYLIFFLNNKHIFVIDYQNKNLFYYSVIFWSYFGPYV